ncbi:MAG: hypothetical protein QMD13_09345 [Candidatus Bathyarchaeia archaeon]|nr:hypothetical protein [Candidatus Bathyarchaeia archaeon]
MTVDYSRETKGVERIMLAPAYPKCRWADESRVWLTNLNTGKSVLAFVEPLQAKVGDPITFLIVAWNMGDADGDCFVKLVDVDTGEEVGRWDGWLAKNATENVGLGIGTMPDRPKWRLRVDCGHYEEEAEEEEAATAAAAAMAKLM